MSLITPNAGSGIIYDAPRTVSDLMCSTAYIRLIAGPIGSGKTTGMIFELLRRAAEQARAPDGYRYTRFAIVRQTLQQIKQTILKDIISWLRGIVVWRVSDSTVYLNVGDIRSEWICVPMENIEDQRRLLSSQLTGIWISECIEIDPSLIDPLVGRCGRYPDPKLGGCSWQGIIMDTNFPEEGSEWYRLMENPEPHWNIFKQPGGLDEHAENLNWLDQTPESLKLPIDHPDRLVQGVGYYIRAASGRSEEWVDRYVRAKYGIDPSGRAVFASSFRPRTGDGAPWHVVPELKPVQGAMLVVGHDLGRDPCALITQVDGWGRLLVLQEVICRHMGLELAVNTKLRPALADTRYWGLPVCISGDPAGAAKSTISEETSFDCFKRLGFNAYPASTNDFDPRVRAVEFWLLGSRNAGPALLIDGSRCPTLVQAMKAGYRFKLMQETGEPGPRPIKNEWSHIAEALQYAALASMPGMIGLIGRHMFSSVKGASRRQVPSPLGWT